MSGLLNPIRSRTLSNTRSIIQVGIPKVTENRVDDQGTTFNLSVPAAKYTL
jgi:hypothetical protein